ncbi:hypothetical protein B566_EDAN000033 [Ephemera danica]|nr:hypothetical protein B566_EDAN000033 [Ephemera danica]
MILVGLTGGIATGKSTVAALFQQCGAVVIDADVLARGVVQPGKPAWREIVTAFGTSVLNPDRTMNRPALGAKVFGHPAKLRQIEQIIHPRVAREQQRLTRLAAQNDPNAVVIYDVPLLFEAGIDARVDTTLVVMADLETQIARLKQRNGLSRSDALRRIKSQMPLAEKRRRADHTLSGTLPLPQLKKRVRSLYQSFRALA